MMCMQNRSFRRFVAIILWIVICTVKGLAQEKFTFYFDTTSHIQSPLFYDKVKVVDKRLVKENIGFMQIQRGKLDLVTSESLEQDFTKYVYNLISDAGKSGKSERELLLVVYGFRAANMNGRATFYLKLEAFAATNESYKRVASIDTFYEHKQTYVSNMKRLIGDNVFDIVSSILSIDPDMIQGNSIYTFEEAQNRISEHKKKYPVYNKPANDGIYKSYDRFLDNKPENLSIIIEKVIITESLVHYYAYERKDNGRKGIRIDAKDFFAAYYKNNWYLSDGKKYNIMTFENDDFFTEISMKGAYSVIYKYTLYGFVNLWTSPVKEEREWGTYKVRLDIDNGKLMPVKRVK